MKVEEVTAWPQNSSRDAPRQTNNKRRKPNWTADEAIRVPLLQTVLDKIIICGLSWKIIA